MKILSPSILSADFGILGQQLKAMDEAGAEYVHIDVMDGVFVPSISYGMPLIKSIRKYTKRFFDVHLMIVEPDRYIKEFVEIGADGITVHKEACKDLKATLELIKSYGVKASVSIKPATAVDEISDVLDMVDMVLIMTVEPGFGGQKLIPETLDKVKELAKLRDEKGLAFDIEVDGGITASNVNQALDAGANVIVAGSAVFNGDIKSNVKALMENFNG